MSLGGCYELHAKTADAGAAALGGQRRTGSCDGGSLARAGHVIATIERAGPKARKRTEHVLAGCKTSWPLVEIPLDTTRQLRGPKKTKTTKATGKAQFFGYILYVFFQSWT